MKVQTVQDELKPALDQVNAEKSGKNSINSEPASDQKNSVPEKDLSKNRFECRECGYVYDPNEGLRKYKIPPGTPFLQIDHETFRCPVCRARYGAYKDIGAKFVPTDGFEENVVYGFGFNNLPPGQKNVLIFGGLAFAAACFLSLNS